MKLLNHLNEALDEQYEELKIQKDFHRDSKESTREYIIEEFTSLIIVEMQCIERNLVQHPEIIGGKICYDNVTVNVNPPDMRVIQAANTYFRSKTSYPSYNQRLAFDNVTINGLSVIVNGRKLDK